MKEVKADLWSFHKQPYAVVCITTNGVVKNDGTCVMGRGCAWEAKQRIPTVAKVLGSMIQEHGNHVHHLGTFLMSFPVKHSWWERADLELIKQSAIELRSEAITYKDWSFYLPRPGCGNGKLSWEGEVKPLLESLDLPDNIVIVSPK